MPNFAVGNPCQNIIVANTLADAEIATNQTCYEYTDDNPAGIGYRMDDDGKWIAPDVA